MTIVFFDHANDMMYSCFAHFGYILESNLVKSNAMHIDYIITTTNIYT